MYVKIPHPGTQLPTLGAEFLLITSLKYIFLSFPRKREPRVERHNCDFLIVRLQNNLTFINPGSRVKPGMTNKKTLLKNKEFLRNINIRFITFRTFFVDCYIL